MLHLSLRTHDYEQGPLVMTKVLNKRECLINSVGVSLFKQELGYVEKGAWFYKTTGISRVLILSGKAHKEYCPPNNYQVEMDIYLTDGRVIEVSTCDRRVIEAALKYAPQKDVRASFRASRGIF